LVIPHQHLNAATLYKQHWSPTNATHLTPCMQAAHSILKRAIAQSAPQASRKPALRMRTRRAKCAGDPKSPVVSPALPRTGGAGAKKRSLGERDAGSSPPQQATKLACSTPLRICRKVCRESHSLCASFPKDCVPLSVCGWVSMNLKLNVITQRRDPGS
jgi:hypothetical protein